MIIESIYNVTRMYYFVIKNVFGYRKRSFVQDRHLFGVDFLFLQEHLTFKTMIRLLVFINWDNCTLPVYN